MAYVSLAKGLAFVLVTAAFLYFLLSRSPRLAEALVLAEQPEAPERRAWLRQPVLVFVLLALAVLGGLALALRHETAQEVELASEQIASIGELKAREIELWLDGQAVAADSFGRAQLPRAAVTRLARGSDGAAKTALTQWLQENAAQVKAAAAFVVDTGGRVIAAAGEQPVLEPALAASIATAVRDDVPVLHELHRRPGEPPRVFLDYIVPWRGEPDGGRVIGALVLRHDAASFLFPLLQSWPTPSASAETMLVRPEGDGALFLNELRHRAGTAFTLRRSLADPDLAAARFLRGARGTLRARDYRGVEVLAFGRPIAGTDWLLVSKIDVDEALAPVRTEVALYGALMLGLTLLAALGTLALWRQQAALTGLREGALRAERDALGKHLTLLSRHANDVILLLDEAGRIVRANDRAKEVYGKRSAVGTSAADLRPPSAKAAFADAYARTLRLGNAIYETTHLHGDGREFPVEISARRIDTPEGKFVQAIIRDLSERRSAEQALAESEARFRAIVEQSISGFYLIQDGRFAYVNPRFASIFGYASPEEVMGRIPDDLIVPRDRALVTANIERRLAGAAKSIAYTFAGLRKDGSEIEVGVHGTAATFDGRPAIVGTLQDISERARAERARELAMEELRLSSTKLRKANRALRTLSAGNETLVRATDEAALLRDMCSVIVQAGNYQLALVGYVQSGEGHPVVPQASAGIALEDIRAMPFPQADPRDPQAPAAIAVRSGKAEVHRDIASDPRYAPWRPFIARHGIASAISMPLRADDAMPPYGMLLIASRDTDAFDPEAVRLLEEMANDLAFGIGILRLREEQRASAAVLRKSLEDTILAIAATAEMRDPYTAGHERRVAELAAAIAREMGLAEPLVEGIRFGSMIHDLGKIKIPAEILVKPSRLTPIEYELIKQHAQAGYDILKGIDFPWPVAQMVLQHHERLDGSGYPNGLKGEAICQEARILSVADTVEAMSSHRPYRPGLGIDKALAEIERGRGALYDPAAVDACLRLHRDKGYTLPG